MANEIEESLRSAQTAFAQGRLADSRRECAALVGRAPRNADALHLGAIVELQSGNKAGAAELIERAIRERPGDARQQQSRGLILRSAGRWPEAAAAFREALRLAPDFADAHAGLGHALLETGNAAEAAKHLEQALRLRPQAAEWHVNLALSHAHMGDRDKAIASARRAFELRPGLAQAGTTLGGLLMQKGDAAGAVNAFDAALRADPRLVEAHNNRGAALLALGRFADAEAGFRDGIAIDPSHSHAWNNLGNALRRQGRASEAEEAFRRATGCEPALDAAWSNLGNILRELERPAEAIEAFARAIAMNPESPEAHLSSSIARLQAGQLASGWEEYRWRHGKAPGMWLRAAVAQIHPGSLVELRGEQGLGDALFFLRWAPALKSAHPHLAFRGDARLAPLLDTRLFERIESAEAPAPEGALEIPVGDLPWLLGDAAPAHPPPLPLAASPQALQAARQRLAEAGPPPYVGVAWRAGIASQAGEEHLAKSVDPGAFGAALRPLDATVVSLQRDPAAGELEALAAALGRDVHDASALNADLPAMLGLLAALDAYVGVSSTNVHMRAGLGKGARILVPFPGEWRYGASAAATPWFPGFKLYREDREAGWTRALAALAGDLRKAGAT